jgi:hypothetical protein
LIDAEGKSHIFNVLTEAGYKTKADSDYVKLVNDAIKSTKMRQTGLPSEYVTLDDTRIQASATFMKNFEKEMKVDTPTANYTTKARAEACASVRNGMSFSSALHQLIGPKSDRISPLLIINVDGTVFMCPMSDLTAKIKVIRTDRIKGEDFKVAPDVHDCDNGKVGGCGIKFYPFITAAGIFITTIFTTFT